jgi:hypothetical protein
MSVSVEHIVEAYRQTLPLITKRVKFPQRDVKIILAALPRIAPTIKEWQDGPDRCITSRRRPIDPMRVVMPAESGGEGV